MTLDAQLPVGSSVASGLMAQSPGRVLPTFENSHPVETAEYAKLMKIDHEPAFNWWVPHVLKKRNRIISLVRKRLPRYLKQKTISLGSKLLPQ